MNWLYWLFWLILVAAVVVFIVWYVKSRKKGGVPMKSESEQKPLAPKPEMPDMSESNPPHHHMDKDTFEEPKQPQM